MPPDRALWFLVLVLRLAGGMTLCAFLAMFLPVDWMVSTHRWLGLGEFPRLPIVDYLTRSVAALYGFHGALLMLIASDPLQHRRIVSFVAVMNVTFGLIMVAIDVHAGLPLWWTVIEGPPIMAFGVVIAWLNRQVQPVDRRMFA